MTNKPSTEVYAVMNRVKKYLKRNGNTQKLSNDSMFKSPKPIFNFVSHFNASGSQS